MCFFSKQTKKAVEVQHRFKAVLEDFNLFVPCNEYNGFSFPKTPVITNESPDTIQHVQWGLIPHWAENDDIKKYTLNAKIETLTEKPSFKDSVHKRCLVIANGFYEWQWLDSKGKRKQKYELMLPDNELFAFAGIWSQWKSNITGEAIKTYSIVTTEANELMSEIHNSKRRMPVILTPEMESYWLNDTPLENFYHPEINLTARKITDQLSLF